MKFAILSAAALLTLATTTNAAVNLVTNPGFETGDLTGWTYGSPGVTIDSTIANVNSGTYAARIYNTIEPKYLSQSIPTIIGHTYRIEFYFKASTNGYFNAYFGPVTIYTDSGDISPYNNYTADVQATSTTTNLLFDGWAWNPQYSIDDVSVIDLDAAPVPEPASLSLLALGTLALLRRRRSCS